MSHSEEYQEYIDMMTKAWPIIKEDIKKLTHTTIFSRRLRMLYILDGEVVMWREKVNTSNYDRAIPLLEQDQWQDLYQRWSLNKTIRDFHCFWKWEFDDCAGDYYCYVENARDQWMPDSMLKLWASFIMLINYNRIWNRKDWIEVK